MIVTPPVSDVSLLRKDERTKGYRQNIHQSFPEEGGRDVNRKVQLSTPADSDRTPRRNSGSGKFRCLEVNKQRKLLVKTPTSPPTRTDPYSLRPYSQDRLGHPPLKNEKTKFHVSYRASPLSLRFFVDAEVPPSKTV